ncbi:MAG: SDR family oxidoreductase [Candidatus Dormibacteraeota bacterium]|nr:SDR family oxidoreductase [Candidatus Dormibacteraeota bacterium]MBV9525590.1 SDR family oxidoreductase [Candidatus Dormibacteraeota bacterium]
MRVLVTGHDGYIGRVLTRVLEEAGHVIGGVDSGYYADCGFDAPARADPAASAPRSDVRDLTVDDLAGWDAVVHLAALCNDPVGDLSNEWTHDINHAGAVHVARLARDAGVKRFLFASSCSVYGDAGTDTELSETSAVRPLTAYAVSKARAEEDLAALAGPGFSPVFLRNGSVYGLSPRFRADIVLNNLVCWAVTTGQVTMFTDGTPWRPLVHVEDVSRAFLTVLTAPRDAVHNEVFNVGVPGENYQVADLAAIVCSAVPGSRIGLVPHAGGDMRDYRVSFAKLASRLPEFTPRWCAADGACEVRDGLRAAGVSQDDFQGPRFTRLARLRQLIDAGAVDSSLRMRQVEGASSR